jgi:catechol 2,3-dioxygenase-like lactoylglutathione lyase family enzyme
MAKAIGIDHIAIYVSDMTEAKKFFLQGLGLEPHGEYGDEFFMKIGDQIIAIFQGSNSTQTINHLALKVDNFDEIKERLKDQEYNMYQGDMVNGPDGIRIQLVK